MYNNLHFFRSKKLRTLKNAFRLISPKILEKRKKKPIFGQAWTA